ncbi:hypothetical protein Dimus_035842 [Dionaea muscipula]
MAATGSSSDDDDDTVTSVEIPSSEELCKSGSEEGRLIGEEDRRFRCQRNPGDGGARRVQCRIGEGDRRTTRTPSFGGDNESSPSTESLRVGSSPTTVNHNKEAKKV